MESGSSMSTSSNETLYVGLGVGIGVVLLVAIAAMCVLIVHKVGQHRRATSLLEQGQLSVSQTIEQRSSHDIRSSMLGRTGSLRINRPGWDALGSTETVDQPNAGSKPIHLQKKSKRYGIPLKRLKHLSAITESPRSRQGLSPAMPTIRHVDEMEEVRESGPSNDTGECVGYAETADVAVQADRNNALRISMPARLYDVDFDADRPIPARSISFGALVGPGSYLHTRRMHVRSVSLGGQPPEQLPPDPVTIPVIAPHNPQADFQRHASQGSTSSEESASSSVLMHSPSLGRTYRKTPPGTPRCRQRTFKYPVPLPHAISMPILSNKENYDQPVSPLSNHELKRELASSSSVSSFDEEINTNSFRRVTNANLPNKSRISPATSGKRPSAKRKASQSTVSATGSPTQRLRLGVLRDLSSNSLLLTRQPSNAASTGSSDGNPFQWDTASIQKPSALKGSPNARKGHRRQNCVRISTLTPQVLGPPPARSTSPSITHRIQEEGGAEQTYEQAFVTRRRNLAPSGGARSAPNLRVQTLRNSLTPSSPTFSDWAAFQGQLPSQPSDSHLTVSSGNLSRTGSSFSIPAFPSPSKTTVSDIQLTQPTPEFYGLPDDESQPASSPFDLNAVLASSPLVLSPPTTYDPSWPPVHKLEIRKYDSASPLAPRGLFDRSPVDGSTVTLSSTESRHDSSAPTYSIRSSETSMSKELTSSNASSMAAKLPSFTFPGAPILTPPPDVNPVPTSQRGKRNEQYGPVPTFSFTDTEEPARLNGPRSVPPKSLLRNVIALRRMNSEVDTTLCRESRTYMRMGRQSSPLLPLYGSPNFNESCEGFDFELDMPQEMDSEPGAHDGIIAGTRFGRETSSFVDLHTIEEVHNMLAQEELCRVSEESGSHWHGHPPESVYSDRNVTPRGQGGKSKAVSAKRRFSIPNTPQSLYGDDGFLRSDY